MLIFVQSDSPTDLIISLQQTKERKKGKQSHESKKKFTEADKSKDNGKGVEIKEDLPQ